MFDSKKNYPKITESHVIIRFQDCDPLGHLNNAKYFDYFFNAREDQVPQVYEINIVDYFKKYESSWVVYQQQIAYLRSALPGEWVRILSSIIYTDEDTIVTEYFMTDEKRRELKSVLWTISKYIDAKSGKRIPHHPEVMEFLKVVTRNDIDYTKSNFNERIKQIKTSLIDV